VAVDTTTTRKAAATKAPTPAHKARRRSSVALKILMAVTGIVLILFLYAHMIGNLKIFFGEETFDHYASWLRTIGTPLLPHDWYLWIQRGGLTLRSSTRTGPRCRAATRPARCAGAA
jgi:succinate dehydrogenase / fumarate reductase cytochrome b subunit